MKRTIFFAILLFYLGTNCLSARTTWGLGLSLGAPTILAHLAIPAGEYLGLDVEIGWSAWDITNAKANGSSFYSIVDIVAWNPYLDDKQNFRFLCGLGVALGVWWQKNKTYSNGFFVGVRIPLGLEFLITKHCETFLKLGPGVLLFPNSSFRIDMSLGVRYVF